MTTAKLSDYMGKLRNTKYLSPERVQKEIENATLKENEALFAKIFPIPAYYGLQLDKGTYTVTMYSGRLEGADAKKKNSNLKTYRDFYILDVEAFEEFLDENVDLVSLLRAPKGTAKAPVAGYMSEELLESMSPEAAAIYAMKLAQERLGKVKKVRVLTEAHKKAMQDARGDKSKSTAQ